MKGSPRRRSSRSATRGASTIPLPAQIAYAIMSELEHETSAGKLLAETLALSLMARLVQNHAGASSSGLVPPAAREGLDPRRLARVLDYIEANLESDLTVVRLASVACLSQFHFARPSRPPSANRRIGMSAQGVPNAPRNCSPMRIGPWSISPSRSGFHVRPISPVIPASHGSYTGAVSAQPAILTSLPM